MWEGFRDADLVITTKTYYRKRPQALRAAEAEGVPVFVLRHSSVSQIEQYLMAVFGLEKKGDPLNSAIKEAEDAVRKVETGEESVALNPQSSFIRRLQHETAERSNLASFSVGRTRCGTLTSRGPAVSLPEGPGPLLGGLVALYGLFITLKAARRRARLLRPDNCGID